MPPCPTKPLKLGGGMSRGETSSRGETTRGEESWARNHLRRKWPWGEKSQTPANALKLIMGSQADKLGDNRKCLVII